MSDILLFDPVYHVLWLICIFLISIGGLLYLYSGIRLENRDEKLIMIGFAAEFFGTLFVRIFFFIAEFYLAGEYLGHSFYGNPEPTTATAQLFHVFSYLSFLIGITIFFFIMEKVIKKTRYILTSANVFFLVMILILPFELSSRYIYIIDLFDFSIVLILIFWFSKRSSPEFQTVAVYLIIGTLITLMAASIDSPIFRIFDLFPHLLAPILYLIGITLTIVPLVLNPKWFSRTKANWLAYSLSLISILLYNSYIIINFWDNSILLITNGFSIPLLIFFLYDSIVRFKRSQGANQINIRKDDNRATNQNIFKAFTRPQKVTEEEISISKEKKICLVCKGTIGGINFMCVECGAFYCNKCYSALTNLENSCWACETALDKSKSIKIGKEEEKEESNEIIHKSKKSE